MLFKLTDVRKSFSGIEVLKGVSFQINPGEKAGLVGRNGAGKTTVFKLITGEESPDSGTIETVNRLRVGLLRQHVDFDDSETVHTAALSAFGELHDIEAEMRVLEVEMAGNPAPDVMDRYSELQIKFEQEGGFAYVAKAESVLMGLNFGKEKWEMRVGHLSGGQKNRLGMACLLLSDADLLLLDEPTNHLDVKTVEWLEKYLSEGDRAYVIISHDRYFLDKTCSRIVELENGFASVYSGNYSKYHVESKLRKEQMQREYENQQAFIQKTESFIRKNLAGQKTKQAKSRRNLLGRLERKDAVVLDADGAGFELGDIERSGGNVLSVKGLSLGYPGTILASGIDFTLHRGDCMGVIGGNGTGKSTFLKTVLGEIRELEGEILWGTKVVTGYYSQGLEGLNLSNDILSEIRTVAPDSENGTLRSFLAGFLFLGDEVFKRVGDLSGGEKGRLALAKLIFSKANVLILDEPTNHLDILSREALERALSAFEGTIVTVSHDRYFLDRLANLIFAFESGTEVEIYNGNYSQYHDWKEKLDSEPVEEAVKRSDKVEKIRRKKSELSKNEVAKIRNRIDELESAIPDLEDEMKRLTGQLSDPAVIDKRELFESVTKNYNRLENKTRKSLKEWEGLLDSLPE